MFFIELLFLFVG